MLTQTTYEHFCSLGGLGGYCGQQGRLMTKNVYNGRQYMYTTYWIFI